MPTITILTILIVLLALALAVFTIHIHARLAKLFRGNTASSLEEHIASLAQEVAHVRDENKKIMEQLRSTHEKVTTSIRGVAMTRFNPFPNAGGNQSFAIALANEKGDGIVLSSLYARDRMSVFAKPIEHGTSTYELTAEEESVIKSAVAKTN